MVSLAVALSSQDCLIKPVRRLRRLPALLKGEFELDIEPAWVNALYTAHGLHRKHLTMRSHKRVLHRDSQAKYAAAFFRMSRAPQ